MLMSLHLKMSINRVSTEHQQSVNGLSTERQQSVNRASTERQQSVNTASTEHQQSINTVSIECQQTVNHFGCCILWNPSAVLWHLSMIEVSATLLGNIFRVNIATRNNEHQQSHSRALTILGIASCIIQGLCYGIYQWSTFGRLYLQYGYCQFRYHLKLIVTRASMLFGNVSMVIGKGYACCYA